MAAVYVSNLVLNTGTTFSQTFTLEDSESNSTLDLTGYSVNSQMKKHPSMLLMSKIWLNRNQAAIVAKTPSSEKIIAAGAGEIFFCA